jgi:threonine synthase
VALAALIKLAERGDIGASDRVVVISTAHGLKFPQFKTGYHWSELEGVASRFANPPVELPDEYDAVVSTIFDRIGR